MFIIPLQQLVNQSVTVTLEQARYVIGLRTIADRTYATIERNGLTLCTSQLCMPNDNILTYAYEEMGGGNFSFYTPNDEYPYYEQFSVTHILLYATAAELATLRAA